MTEHHLIPKYDATAQYVDTSQQLIDRDIIDGDIEMGPLSVDESKRLGNDNQSKNTEDEKQSCENDDAGALPNDASSDDTPIDLESDISDTKPKANQTLDQNENDNSEPNADTSVSLSAQEATELQGASGDIEHQTSDAVPRSTPSNNLSSHYEVDQGAYIDDYDDNPYSALCLPCSPTSNTTTLDTTTSLAQSPPQSAVIGNESSSSSTTRLVAPTCAICLIHYIPGCFVSWSSNKECLHAFHRDCILMWLLKKEEPLCPCCRQEFVLTSMLNDGVDGIESVRNGDDTTAADAPSPVVVGERRGGIGIDTEAP